MINLSQHRSILTRASAAAYAGEGAHGGFNIVAAMAVDILLDLGRIAAAAYCN